MSSECLDEFWQLILGLMFNMVTKFSWVKTWHPLIDHEIKVIDLELFSLAQSDACLTSDQVISGSIPAESGNILSWRLIMKYFLWSFSPFRRFKKGSCQFLAKECAQIFVNHLED